MKKRIVKAVLSLTLLAGISGIIVGNVLHVYVEDYENYPNAYYSSYIRVRPLDFGDQPVD